MKKPKTEKKSDVREEIQQVNVYLPKSTYNKLKAKADSDCRSVAAAIRFLILIYIAEK